MVPGAEAVQLEKLHSGMRCPKSWHLLTRSIGNVHISAVEFPSRVELGRVVDDSVVRSLEAVLKNRHHVQVFSVSITP